MTFIEDLARAQLEGLEQIRRDFGRKPRRTSGGPTHRSARRLHRRQPPAAGD